MKELFIKLREAEERANAADAAYEANPYNEEIERKFDEAYTEEHKAFTELVTAISEFTSGRVSLQEAAEMVKTRREKLESFFM